MMTMQFRFLSSFMFVSLIVLMQSACGVEEEEVFDPSDVNSRGMLLSETLPIGSVLEATGNVNFRLGASTSYEILGVVLKGNRVTTVETETPTNGYYKVKFQDKVGWTYGVYFKLISSETQCGKAEKPTQYVWPVPKSNSFCQKFKNPITYQPCGFHTGIDVCAKNGDELVSIADGVVVHVGPLWLEGPHAGRGPYSIMIQHSPRFYSTYGHNETVSVKPGQCVKAGEHIGTVGNLGYSFGPHLHLELLNNTSYTGNWKNPFINACNYYVDPMGFIKKP